MRLHLHFEITDRHISELERAAVEHGDVEQAALCRAALAGDADARAKCVRVLGDALNADDQEDEPDAE